MSKIKTVLKIALPAVVEMQNVGEGCGIYLDYIFIKATKLIR